MQADSASVGLYHFDFTSKQSGSYEVTPSVVDGSKVLSTLSSISFTVKSNKPSDKSIFAPNEHMSVYVNQDNKITVTPKRSNGEVISDDLSNNMLLAVKDGSKYRPVSRFSRDAKTNEYVSNFRLQTRGNITFYLVYARPLDGVLEDTGIKFDYEVNTNKHAIDPQQSKAVAT